METLSLPDGTQRPWKRAVVVEDTGSRRAPDQKRWLADASRVPTETFEPHWQEILRAHESWWINIVPNAGEGDRLVVVVEYRRPTGCEPVRSPDQIRIPGHALPASYQPPGSQPASGADGD